MTDPQYFEAIVPEDGVNRVFNGSGEGGTNASRLYWKTQGLSTLVTLVTDGDSLGGGLTARARHGRRAFRLASTTTNTGPVWQTDTLPALEQTVSFWAAPSDPAANMPSNLRVGIGTYATPTLSYEATATLIEQDGNGWSRYQAVFSGAQCSGKDAVFVLTPASGTVSVDILIDGVMIEEAGSASVYFDGDSGDGHRWDRTAYESTSYRYKWRSDDTPNVGGGFAYWLDNGTSVLCNMAVGIGIPPIQHMVNENGAGHGSVYQSARIDPRDLVLTFTLNAATLSELHSLRQTLGTYFQVGDPFVLRYHGADAVYEITVVYAGGMDFGETFGGTKQKIAVRLTAYDPFFRDLSSSSVSLSLSTTASHAYLSIRERGEWTAPTGIGAAVNKVYVSANRSLYVAAGASVYRRTRTGWTTILTTAGTLNGLGPIVRDMAESLDGTLLYVTGHFATVGGVTYNGLCKVLTASPYTVSNVVSGSTNFSGGGGYCLALSPDSKRLFLGGDFTHANGTEYRRAVRVDNLDTTPAFAEMDAGLTGTAYSIVVNAQGEAFYGGAFGAGGLMDNSTTTPSQTSISGSLNSLVSRQYAVVPIDKDGKWGAMSAFCGPSGAWTGSRVTITRVWGAVYYRLYCSGSNGTFGPVTGLTLIPDPGTGTTFTVDHTTQSWGGGIESGAFFSQQVGTSATPKIARYNVTDGRWHTVGVSGFNNTVYGLALAPDNLTMYAAGAFAVADGGAATGCAMLVGSIWNPMSGGLTGTAYCVAIHPDGSVWFGGAITAAAGNTLCVGLARYIGSDYGGSWLHSLIQFPNGTQVNSIATRYDDLVVGHNQSASIKSAAVTTVVYGGTTDGYPVIEAYGPMTFWGLMRYPGDALLCELSVGSGEIVTFDLRPGRKVVTSNQTSRGNLTSMVKPGSPLGTFHITPGTLRILAFSPDAGSGSQLRLLDRGSYLAADGAA